MNNLICAAGIALLAIQLIGLPCVALAAEDRAYDPDALEVLRQRTSAGEFEAVEAEARAILVEVEREEGPDSLAVADVISVIVGALPYGPDPAAPDSIALAERAVAIAEAQVGPVHMETARAVNNLASLYVAAGRYESARPLLERSLAIRRELHGPDDPIVARGHNNLARMLYRAGDLPGALEAFRKAQEILERAEGPDSPSVGIVVMNGAILTMELGRYAEAIPLYERALAILEKEHGPEHSTVARVLNNLAIATELSGDYAGAKVLYERCLTMRRKILGPDAIETGSTLANLAILNHTIGDEQGALEQVGRAVEIYEKSLGPDHPETLRIVNIQGGILEEIGETDRAIALYERTLAGRLKAFGPEHHDVAESQSSLAALYLDRGDAKKALPLLTQALATREASLGEDHPVVAGDLGHLATAQVELGDLAAARAALDRALAIREKRLGPDHPGTAAGLVQLAELDWKEGKRDAALARARRASGILLASARDTLAVLPERQALLLVADQVRPEEIFFSGLLASDDKPGPWLEACWEWSLSRRGLVLDVLAERHRTALAAESKQTHAAWDELAEARRELAELWVGGVEGLDPETHQADLDRARRRKEQAESGLARASLSYRGELQLRRTSIGDLANSLPADSALVEWVRVRAGAGSKESRRIRDVALLLGPQGGRAFVDLGPAEAIDGAVNDWRAALDRTAHEAGTGAQSEDAAADPLRPLRSAGERLRGLVWDPLPASIRAMERIYLVPDGAMHMVDLAALPDRRGGYLIEQGPSIRLLGSGRDLVRLARTGGSSPSGGRGLLALGDPDFDADRSARRMGAADQPVVIAAYRGETPDCLGVAGTTWNRLPESGREVQRVSELYGDDEPVLRLTGAGASEERFKRDAPGRRVLHLATHGYFLGEECGGTAGAGAAPGGATSPAGESPLLRSGLVLAGANRSDGGGSSDPGVAGAGEDGILTAEELAALDLRGVELAVLSACDTGRGDIAVGEGVFGLRRALAISGVRSIVMSLWPMPDRQARLWMTSFYRGRLDGASISEAARQAALANLMELRDSGSPEHPYDWAGLVVAGD